MAKVRQEHRPPFFFFIATSTHLSECASLWALVHSLNFHQQLRAILLANIGTIPATTGRPSGCERDDCEQRCERDDCDTRPKPTRGNCLLCCRIVSVLVWSPSPLVVHMLVALHWRGMCYLCIARLIEHIRSTYLAHATVIVEA